MSASLTHPLSKSMDSILQEARRLNSDIGRHSVKCNFSTRLSGRFYQNSSLERNTARKSKLLEMQARKRRLERELHEEEHRVKLLETRLNETERSRDDAHELIAKIERGIVAFQTMIRRNQAVSRYLIIKHEARMRKLVAIYLQSYYRGWKGRSFAQLVREEKRRRIRNRSAIIIQTAIRQIIQRRHYIDLLSRNRMLGNQSASAIQAMLRGKMTRRLYLQEMQRRESAAIMIQRIYRGKLGRAEYNRLRQLWLEKQKKPKRVPLHMRRYSTYGNRSPRKMPKKLVMTRRRSSVEDMSQFLKMKISNEQDENDSVATTLTSLTHATDRSQRRRIARVKMSDSTNKASKPTRPSTHRALSSVSKQNGKAETKSKSNTGTSDLSTANTSKKSGEASKNTKIDGQSRKTKLRRSIHSGASKELNSRVSTFVSGNLTKEHKHEESQDQNETSVPIYVSATSDCGDELDEQVDLTVDARVVASMHSEMEESREKMSTPLVISREASLLVEEVLGRTIITHSIANSTFDDEFSEHEDDLE